jgi:Domain of unknown function (DUF4283)
MFSVLEKRVWTYMREVVALKHALGPANLTSEHVDHLEAWVQLHKIPMGALTNQGIEMLASKVGPPLSEVQEIQVNGQRCLKINLLIPVKTPL